MELPAPRATLEQTVLLVPPVMPVLKARQDLQERMVLLARQDLLVLLVRTDSLVPRGSKAPWGSLARRDARDPLETLVPRGRTAQRDPQDSRDRLDPLRTCMSSTTGTTLVGVTWF